MLTIENFKKNNQYSNEDLSSMIKTCDSWTDDQIWYIYDNAQDAISTDDDRKNLIANIVRIHPHIKDRAVQIIRNRVPEYAAQTRS